MGETTKTVLVADDDEIIRKLVTFRLERDGHKVLIATDGLEALSLIREEHPDLCVMDVMMPKLTGVEVLHELRSDPDLAELPVILLTSRGQDADLERGFDAGATDYVVKPFSPEELRQRVRRALAV